MSNKLNVLMFVSITALLIIVVILCIDVLSLNKKVNSVSTEVKNTNQDITCSEVYHDGNTGQDSCIGIKDQLNDIQQRLH